jgi:hypothetical protein
MDLRLPPHLYTPGMAPPRDDPPHRVEPRLPPPRSALMLSAVPRAARVCGLRDWRRAPARTPSAGPQTQALSPLPRS